MTQLFPIIIVAIVLIADSSPGLARTEPLLDPPWTTVLALGPVLAILLLAALGLRRCDRRLARGQAPGPIIAADRMLAVARWAIVVAHASAVLLLGWLAAVRAVIGDWILLDELIVLLPPLAGALGLWYLHYPIERRLREALLLRRLDTGQPIYRIPSRGQYVLQQVRTHLLLLLVPVLLILGVAETIHLVFARFGQDRWPTWWADAATFAAGLTVFTIAPLLARLVLSVEPLGAGPVRDDLDEVCRRHRVRVRQFLLWRTDGSMINAAVMGVLGFLRYVLLTDSLVEALPREQVRAVMAHEVGHVRRHHLPWLVLTLFALLMAAGFIVTVPLLAIDAIGGRSDASTVAWVDGAATAVAAVAALLAFGWVSRRYERQADTFAVQHLSGLGETDATDARITEEAVGAMHGALGGVARLNTVDPGRRSWRHGSIRWRQEYLQSLVGRPVKGLAIDRLVRWVKVVAAVALVLGAVATALTWDSGSPPTPTTIANGADAP
ncbi:MAG: M48 family metalloprotease [Planctomycetes bacterium]|nr:M48 family metalloprotease [Planctomycetota bacterium]